MEKVDLAVPGSDRRSTCDRCFAFVDADAAVCPECGAPLKTEVTADGVESLMHAELAQANLLKVRGDADGAEKKCLSILKRYPNEPEAHSMLGDLSAEKADWRRAAEWYELALDLSPNSMADRARLEDARQRIAEADQAETIEQLGLPETHSKGWWVAGTVIGIVVLVSFCGILVENNSRHHPVSSVSTTSNSVQYPTTTGAEATLGTPKLDPSKPLDTPESGPGLAQGNQPASSAIPIDDRAAMQLLQQHSGAGDQIMSLQQDPRDDQITVTFEVPGSDDVRKLAATLAKDTLDQFPGTPLVTVRGISGGEIVFVADATRLHLKELQASGAADATASLLQREWPAASASGASQPTTTAAQLSASGTATASTSGSAAPSPQGTDPAAQLGH